jgi:hypothetical protein
MAHYYYLVAGEDVLEVAAPNFDRLYVMAHARSVQRCRSRRTVFRSPMSDLDSEGLVNPSALKLAKGTHVALADIEHRSRYCV